MSVTTVLYPKGVAFKLDYYLSHHMPLVGKLLSSHGLKGWKVTDMGEDADYRIAAFLEWDSFESFASAATTPEMKEILDDVPNFSDKQPVMLPGKTVGTS